MANPPQTGKAAILKQPKTKLVIEDRQLAPLKDDEILIRIKSTAINPVDWKMRDYDIFIKEYPTILGSDGAGTVVAVGSDVTGFTSGDRVFFQGIIGQLDSSTFQEYCKMPAKLAAKTPANISDEEAAGICVASVAVITAFYDTTGHGMTPPWASGGDQAGRGKAVIVIGGSSSVGQYAIQLAKLSGFSKIITNASPANHDMLQKLGADLVLDRSKATVEDFKKAVGDLPLAFVFDSISEVATQLFGIQILQSITQQETEVQAPQLIHLSVMKSDEPKALSESKEPRVDIRGVLGLGSSPKLRHLSEPFMEALGGKDGYLAHGRFVPNKPRIVEGGLSAAEEALALNKKGVSGTKVVICP